jgi:serine/threonine protein kinase
MSEARITQGSTVTLGKLTIGARLGAGGFGVVHEATLEGIGISFAIKFLEPSVANGDSDDAARRFLREAEFLFRLRHEHIVPIYGVGENEGRPYILMEPLPRL